MIACGHIYGGRAEGRECSLCLRLDDLSGMLALSVRAPFAWAIIHGGKDIENRTKGAMKVLGKTRGRIAIHSSQTMTQSYYKDARQFMGGIGVECPMPDALMRGAVIGTVEVVDAIDASDSKWFTGPCGLVLRNPRPITPRGHCSGQLGYFSPVQTYQPFVMPKPWMSKWAADYGRSKRP